MKINRDGKGRFKGHREKNGWISSFMTLIYVLRARSILIKTLRFISSSRAMSGSYRYHVGAEQIKMYLL